MDLRVVREEAIEATTRAFWDKNGFVPDQESDEWEAEYRRQFEGAKKRHETGQAAEVKPGPAVSVSPEEDGWAVLTGAPTQIRWAAALRADRIRNIKNPGIRHWLAATWPKAKRRIKTREELDRHPRDADADLPAKDPAPLRGIPPASRRTRSGAGGGKAGERRRRRG